MSRRVLITGGAGFIGSHFADTLLARGYEVRALDNLSDQVHGQNGDGHHRPDYLDPEVEFLRGDICDPNAVRKALEGVESVVHLAGAVGVGQSMYEITRYTTINNLGTAILLEALFDKPVNRLVVASSMSIYGEGLYKNAAGDLIDANERTIDQLKNKDWELRGEEGELLTPLPTPETKRPALASIYALSKYDQERMCLLTGRAYGIPATALRFFNVFGPRQALSNPYTGVLAIFASRLLNDQPPLINEDGLQRRDFVSVHDVADACCLALEAADADGEVFNIGSGRCQAVLEIAGTLSDILGRSHIAPEITAQYRTGDIRHCYADISKARRLLSYEPQVGLQEGLQELAEWLDGKTAVDHVARARQELVARGLTI